jgi:hypothetical protein
VKPEGVEERNRSRKARFLVLDHEKDLVAPHFHPVGGDGFDGWHAESLASPNIEASTVPWALDFAVGQLAFSQGTTIVSADVVDGIESAADVEKGNGPAFNVKQSLFPGGHLRAVCYLEWSKHQASVLSAAAMGDCDQTMNLFFRGRRIG